MADAKFTDRAALEAWAAQRAKDTWPHDAKTMLARLEEIRRVTLAHAHLEEK